MGLDREMKGALQGKFAIITGANQGLGFAIAKSYLGSGVAGLALCARNGEQLNRAKEELERIAKPGQAILAQKADVSREEDVSKLMEATLGAFGRVDILVNNAGVYGPKGGIEDVDWGEWTRTIEINLFGSILMCRAVLPHMKAQRYGKIVQLSGGGATNPLPMLSAYAVSKAAIIRFVETLAQETKDDRIDVNAIAPGALNTRMLDEILEAGPEKVGKEFYKRSLDQKQNGGAPLEKGADLAVFLGSESSDGITGKLISAIWDPWISLPEHRVDLSNTDIYTLRRIVPGDRGMTWDDDK
jgi:NAD(P)-dependent dehydrogenase (short-subunit alcohol dehydrogenase family)